MRQDELQARIVELLGADLAFVAGAEDSAPTTPGAYALLITLDAPLHFIWRGSGISLGEGLYIYSGSARGPGGIRSRLRHHFRRGKRPHWHVDHLTNAARGIWAAATTNRSECDIADLLNGSGDFDFPIPGFGSSDCRRCRSHLLRYRVDTCASLAGFGEQEKAFAASFRRSRRKADPDISLGYETD